MLTFLLYVLPDTMWRWGLQMMGLSPEAVHDWIPAFCRCGEDHQE